MSATDKATVLMLLPHVIGPVPDVIFPQRLHVPLATAVARAQLMVLAVRGRRSYTKPELELIFDDGFVVFFGALESLNNEVYDAAVQEYNRKVRAGKNPGKKPKKFKKQTRLALSVFAFDLMQTIKSIVNHEQAVSCPLLTMNFILNIPTLDYFFLPTLDCKNISTLDYSIMPTLDYSYMSTLDRFFHAYTRL
jgi:hypothetical protein